MTLGGTRLSWSLATEFVVEPARWQALTDVGNYRTTVDVFCLWSVAPIVRGGRPIIEYWRPLDQDER
jgi:hypothetical protein